MQRRIDESKVNLFMFYDFNVKMKQIYLTMKVEMNQTSERWDPFSERRDLFSERKHKFEVQGAKFRVLSFRQEIIKSTNEHSLTGR